MDQAIGFIREGRESLDILILAQDMLAGAWAHHEQADAILAERSDRWDVHRMPVVDRNILRLAIWELSTEHASIKVVINEAVRLAKEFSTGKSPAFINGVLDSASRLTDTPDNDDDTES